MRTALAPLLLVLLAPTAACSAGQPAAATPATVKSTTLARASAPKNSEPPDFPTPRQVEHHWMSVAEWQRRVQLELDAPHRATAQIAFVGDSITEAWCQTPKFAEAFGAQQPLNLGIGGDQTQHVLWRLQKGVLDDTHPRRVVVMIGINNLSNGHTPEQTASGIAAVVRSVRQLQPSAQIMLLAVLPAAQTATDPLRRSISDTNSRLPAIAAELGATLLDFGGAFLDPDGRISANVMADFLHPTTRGYDLLTEQLAAHLRHAR